MFSRVWVWGFHIGRRAVVFNADVKIPPLGSMLNFDADVKKLTRVTNVKTAFRFVFLESVSLRLNCITDNERQRRRRQTTCNTRAVTAVGKVTL